MTKAKVSKSSKSKQKSVKSERQEEIVIDKSKQLVFKTEKELFSYFESDISMLESEFYKYFKESDGIEEKNFDDFEDLLLDTLAEPDMVYESNFITDKPTRHFAKTYESEDGDEELHYVAVAYVDGDEPSFIYLHFPTKSKELFEHFSQGSVVYDAQKDYEEGDALSDGDELAMGLYHAMLKIRSDKDIPEEDFKNYKHLRDEGIEEPDEIWRDPDLQGNVLVSFIKDFSEVSKDLFMVSVALEDATTDSHVLLFSFPTNDKSLVERYKHGESLHAEEVTQSDSH